MSTKATIAYELDPRFSKKTPKCEPFHLYSDLVDEGPDDGKVYLELTGDKVDFYASPGMIRLVSLLKYGKRLWMQKLNVGRKNLNSRRINIRGYKYVEH